jgi:hypothetical protein
MKTLKHWERVQKIHERILTEKTGGSTVMAGSLRISESLFFKTIEAMKIYGFLISFCRKRRTYFYTEPCEFEFNQLAILKTSSHSKNLLGL